jgi:hypothetical protein
LPALSLPYCIGPEQRCAGPIGVEAETLTTPIGNFQMPQLYESPDQETLHSKAIQSLALETGYALTVVKQVYEAQLAQLQAKAQLKEYVLLLSCRRTRETLRARGNRATSQAVAA